MTTLDQIRNCLEGVVPAFLATSDGEGMPNVSEISQVHYVDPGHVALSYQFFNKTRRNVLATRVASVIVVDPDSNAQYRLELDFEETQTGGPLFEAMRAKLAGIASHTHMESVFRLLGSDVYEVRAIEPLPSRRLEVLRPCNPLSAARGGGVVDARRGRAAARPVSRGAGAADGDRPLDGADARP